MNYSDTIIIGGGAGGLAAGALLAARGVDVTLLESHSSVGGCIGYFDRYRKQEGRSPERFRFDVGATTLSALEPGQPLGRLFEAIGSRPSLRRIDPGMIVHLPDGSRLYRWADHRRWIDECSRVMGADGFSSFWQQVVDVSSRGWALSRSNPTFPPKSIGDLIRMATPQNIANVGLLRYLRLPVAEILRRHRLDRHPLVRPFVDEQLMITAQNDAAGTPFFIGAMGLAYPADTWYVDGGMYSLAEHLALSIERNGGQVRLKRRVIRLEHDGKMWQAITSRGEIYRARRVVSNVTLHDMPRLLGEHGEYFRSQAERVGEGWGAFTLYMAVRNDFDDMGSLYHQIHVPPLPEGGARSIFLSLSHPDDELRHPRGWRVLSVSTHLADPGSWFGHVEYAERKRELARHVVRHLEHALPGIAHAERAHVIAGTPKSFARYTGRHKGMVGGIPHSIDRSLLGAPAFTTPLPELYLVGDTVYPGQGVPAVVLGALNLVGCQ